jgi:hypothetical protein
MNFNRVLMILHNKHGIQNELHEQQVIFGKKRDWNWNYIDFNKNLVTLHNKHGIKWITNDF